MISKVLTDPVIVGIIIGVLWIVMYILSKDDGLEGDSYHLSKKAFDR